MIILQVKNFKKKLQNFEIFHSSIILVRNGFFTIKIGPIIGFLGVFLNLQFNFDILLKHHYKTLYYERQLTL